MRSRDTRTHAVKTRTSTSKNKTSGQTRKLGIHNRTFGLQSNKLHGCPIAPRGSHKRSTVRTRPFSPVAGCYGPNKENIYIIFSRATPGAGRTEASEERHGQTTHKHTNTHLSRSINVPRQDACDLGRGCPVASEKEAWEAAGLAGLTSFARAPGADRNLNLLP